MADRSDVGELRGGRVMRHMNAYVGAVLSAALSSAALAQYGENPWVVTKGVPATMGPSSVSEDPGAGGVDVPRGAVVARDTASSGLMMFADQSNFRFINSGGDASVRRAVGFVPTGATASGSDIVVSRWNEFPGSSSNKIQVIWATQNGTDLLPSGQMVNGRPAAFLGWRFGATDPANFNRTVMRVDLFSVKVLASNDRGQSFDVYDFTNFFVNPWNGRDVGLVLPLAGQGVNFLIAEYEYRVQFTPTPGTALPLLAGMGLLARRRRR